MTHLLHYSPIPGVQQTLRTNISEAKEIVERYPFLDKKAVVWSDQPEYPFILHPIAGREAEICAKCCEAKQNINYKQSHIDPGLNLDGYRVKECHQCRYDYDRPYITTVHYRQPIPSRFDTYCVRITSYSSQIEHNKGEHIEIELHNKIDPNAQVMYAHPPGGKEEAVCALCCKERMKNEEKKHYNSYYGSSNLDRFTACEECVKIYEDRKLH